MSSIVAPLASAAFRKALDSWEEAWRVNAHNLVLPGLRTDSRAGPGLFM